MTRERFWWNVGCALFALFSLVGSCQDPVDTTEFHGYLIPNGVRIKKQDTNFIPAIINNHIIPVAYFDSQHLALVEDTTITDRKIYVQGHCFEQIPKIETASESEPAAE